MGNFLSRENLQKTGITPATASKTLTLADTEYTYTPPEGTKQLSFQLRGGSYDLKYAFASGGVFLVVPAGSPGKFLQDIWLDGNVVLYLKCSDAAGQIVDIEYWV